MRIMFFLVLVDMIASCGKKRSIHITATNGATGEPYAGLQYFVVSSTTTGEKYKTEKSGFLNENGEATEIVREKQYRTYAVRVVEPENSCYNKEITMYFGGANDKNGHFDFVFAECAYLKLNINNINCQGGGDIMKFRSKYSYTDWEGWSTDRLGCYSVISPYPFEVPAGWRVYEWRVNRNGVITDHLDSIYLNPGIDNGTFDMEY